MNSSFGAIFDYVKGLSIIDTHEHLPLFESYRDRKTDVIKEYLIHYFPRDLISAGLSMADYQRTVSNDLSVTEKWNLLEPYWDVCRYTGYGRALDIAARDLYGVDRIDRSSIENLNRSFIEALDSGRHYSYVLHEKSNIKVSIVDSESTECDSDFFRISYHVDGFIAPGTIGYIKHIEDESGVLISSFDDWLETCYKMLDKAFENGAVSLKSALAYERTLKYDNVTKYQAEQEFNRIFEDMHGLKWTGRNFLMGKNFQDYMMHHILNYANKKGVTFQFHTGIQEGNGNIVYNSDPALLSNLFLQYPNVKFDIFHMGYPYQQVVSVLAKTFPNVYIDMCWAHIVSPTASINALIEWIDCVPLNKISAFGGDYCFVDGVYAHQYMARENVSKALSKKVDEGLFDVSTAKHIANMLFFDNPCNLFLSY